jgi:hypothetical protein
LLLDDRENMVGLNETVDVFNALPQAQLGVLPGTPHRIEQANAHVLSRYIINFLDGTP